MSWIEAFIAKHWGEGAAILYVLLAVHGKAVWRWIRGTYVSYEKLDLRIKTLEGTVNSNKTEVNNHKIDDTAQFVVIKESMAHMMGEIHSYFETVRGDIKEVKDEMRGDIKNVSGRVDEIWAFLGKK